MPRDEAAQRHRFSKTWRVVVLLGGTSAERDISLISGEAVAQALAAAGHRVTRIDPQVQAVEEVDWSDADVAFIALHGTSGEDGQVQRKLDHLGVPYTGSGALPSELAFHKLAAKQRFAAAGLPTPPFRGVSEDAGQTLIRERAEELGYPLVVKPEAQGSSLGVSIVHEPSKLISAVDCAREFDRIVFLERGIPGEEWTVPVFDDAVLPPIRITTPHEFFDFSAKYTDQETQYDVITDPAHGVATRVQDLARQACRVLGCRGISRVDLRADAAGQAWLLEVNTIPGLTDHSLVPKSAAAIGWSMSRLCEEMIRAALETP